MAAASHIEDPKIIEELEKLGYTHATIVLLPMMPLVELAWIDGFVSSRERDLVLAEARNRGIDENTLAYEQLNSRLDERPSAEFFERNWRAIEAALATMSPEEREARKKRYVETSEAFAIASGQHLAWAGWVNAAKRKLLKATRERLRKTQSAMAGTAHAA